MKSFTRSMLMLAAVALFSMSASEVNAQDYNSGYGFGLGYSQGTTFGNPGRSGITTFGNSFGSRRGVSRRGLGFGFRGYGGVIERSEDLPYFAKFPPVYYSGKVSRPYGISPFAAPPGITPVEMSAVPVVQKVLNPFFDAEPEQVQVEEHVSDTPVDNHTTKWNVNPYTDWQATNE